MNYFFGRVDSDTLNLMSNDELDNLFYNQDGEAFWFVVELDEDGFVISDTCGRLMPIDFTQVKEFAAMAMAVSTVYKASEDAEALFDARIDHVNASLALTGFPLLAAA